MGRSYLALSMLSHPLALMLIPLLVSGFGTLIMFSFQERQAQKQREADMQIELVRLQGDIVKDQIRGKTSDEAVKIIDDLIKAGRVKPEILGMSPDKVLQLPPERIAVSGLKTIIKSSDWISCDTPWSPADASLGGASALLVLRKQLEREVDASSLA